MELENKKFQYLVGDRIYSVKDLHQGNMNAVLFYCARYFDPLKRLTIYVIKSEAQAGHLVQRNFEELWDKRKQMTDERSVHTFLRKNMYGICCSWLTEQLIINGFLTWKQGWKPTFSILPPNFEKPKLRKL